MAQGEPRRQPDHGGHVVRLADTRLFHPHPAQGLVQRGRVKPGLIGDFRAEKGGTALSVDLVLDRDDTPKRSLEEG